MRPCGPTMLPGSGRLRVGAQGSGPEEETVFDFTSELLRDKQVSDATFERAKSRLGMQGVVDMTGIVGYYTFLAMQLNVAQYPPPRTQRSSPRWFASGRSANAAATSVRSALPACESFRVGSVHSPSVKGRNGEFAIGVKASSPCAISSATSSQLKTLTPTPSPTSDLII